MAIRVKVLVPLLFVTTVLFRAQESKQLKVDVRLVTLDVYVDDDTGRPVTTLNRDDFLAFEDGAVREIQSFDSAVNPYNILLLFDRSASTEEQWPFLAKAIARFVDQLRDEDRVALAAFDEKPEMLFTWTSPRQFSQQAFSILLKNSGTKFYRAMEWAAGQMRGVKGRKGVVVLSDGIDNQISRDLVSFDKDKNPTIAPPEADRDFQKMLRTVTNSQTPFYFIGVNTDQNLVMRTTPSGFDLQQRRAARVRMEIVANRSNGSLRLPRELDELGALYEKIGRELGYSYNLGFAPAAVTQDGLLHRIEIRVRDSSLHVTQSRDGYYAQ